MIFITSKAAGIANVERFNQPDMEHPRTSCDDRSGDEKMIQSFRKSLADSHVAAIAIAILLFWAILSLASGVRPFFEAAIRFVFYAIGALDLAYGLTALRDFQGVYQLAGFKLVYSLIELFAAYILARLIYDTGPITALSNCGETLGIGNHA